MFRLKSRELAIVLAGVTSQNSQVGDHPFQPPAKAESPGADDTGRFGILHP